MPWLFKFTNVGFRFSLSVTCLKGSILAVCRNSISRFDSFTSDIHQRGHPSVYPSLRVRIDSRRTHGLSGLDFFESRGVSGTKLHGIYLQAGFVSHIITQTPLRLTSDFPRFHPGVLYFWFVKCTVLSVPVIKLSPVQWRLSLHTWGT